MDKTEINDRFISAINHLIKDKGLSKTSIAASLGIKPSKFSEILNNRMNAGTDMIALLCEIYSFSAIWILNGRGSMNTNDNNGSNSPVAKQTDNPQEGIPLIPVEAMAGALTAEQNILEYECERYIVPMFKGADFLIPVKGSSMYPKYSSGDVVACQRVPMSDMFFQWNKVYVIDTRQGALIKRIKPGSDKDHVLIVSDNEKYDPFELPISALNAVALVIGVIRLE